MQPFGNFMNIIIAIREGHSTNTAYVNTHDAVELATEFGRLDFLNAVLASIAVLLAVFGFIFFFEVRHRARKDAREEARKAAESIAEEIANEYMIKELPKIRKEYLEVLANDVDNKQSNDIANSFK